MGLFLRVKKEVMSETDKKTTAAAMKGRPLFIGQAPAGVLMPEETRIYIETALKAMPVQNVISDMSLIFFDFIYLSKGILIRRIIAPKKGQIKVTKSLKKTVFAVFLHACNT